MSTMLLLSLGYRHKVTSPPLILGGLIAVPQPLCPQSNHKGQWGAAVESSKQSRIFVFEGPRCIQEGAGLFEYQAGVAQ